MLVGIVLAFLVPSTTARVSCLVPDLVVADLGLRQASALFILGAMSLFLIVIHLGFASATALASAMIPIVIAVLQGVATPGINAIGMTMLLQFVVSFGFILVVNAPQNMVAYGTETFEAKDFVRTGLVLRQSGHAATARLDADQGSFSLRRRGSPASTKGNGARRHGLQNDPCPHERPAPRGVAPVVWRTARASL
jgi:hypothetical protein